MYQYVYKWAFFINCIFEAVQVPAVKGGVITLSVINWWLHSEGWVGEYIIIFAYIIIIDVDELINGFKQQKKWYNQF